MTAYRFACFLLCAAGTIWIPGCERLTSSGSAPENKTSQVSGPGTKTVEGADVKELEPAEAKDLVAGGNLVVIDVRTPEEFGEGHIAGAINVDVRDPVFDAAIEKLDKSKPFLVYCRSGNRSRTAIDKLKEAGFSEIYHLTKGIRAWQEEGNPVVAE